LALDPRLCLPIETDATTQQKIEGINGDSVRRRLVDDPPAWRSFIAGQSAFLEAVVDWR
jgi:hypothetical protein